MRAPLSVERTTTEVDDFDVFSGEHAIAQADVDIVAQRGVDAGKQLPCKVSARIIDRGATSGTNPRFDARASHTDTGTCIELKAVVRTEVEETVQHEAEGINAAVSSIFSSRSNLTNAVGEARTDVDAVERGIAVAGFCFEAERAEVITDITTAIETVVGIEADDAGFVAVGIADGEVEIFREHRAEFGADVPRIISCEGRRCKGRRGHRHS